jgi:hypothetical protein
MTDPGPCNTWVTHDLSAFIDEATLFGSGSGVTWDGTRLTATSLSFGAWYFTLPTVALDPAKNFQVEVTFDSADTGFDPGTGTDVVNLWSLNSVDPLVEPTTGDDFNVLADYTMATSRVGNVVTYTIGPGVGAWDVDVASKGYVRLLIGALQFSTHIAQVRTMLVCDVAGGPNFRRRRRASPLRRYPRNDGLAGSVPRLWPPPQSTQASNRRQGGYQ